MKNMLLTLSNTKRKLVLGGAVAALSLLVSPILQAQPYSDNWNDGNDTSPAWSHFGNSTYSSWTFPINPADSSYAYRIQSATPSGPMAGSFFTSQPNQANFTMSVDLIDWNADSGVSRQVFGLMGRANPSAPQIPTGYGLMVRQPSGGPGAMSLQINRMGADVGGVLALTNSGFLTPPTPAGDYTLVFTATGTTLKGQIFDKATGLAMQLQNGFDYLSVTDPYPGAYTTGAYGVGGFLVNVTPVDVTFDNFVIVPEPSALALGALGLAGLFWAGRRGRLSRSGRQA